MSAYGEVITGVKTNQFKPAQLIFESKNNVANAKEYFSCSLIAT